MKKHKKEIHDIWETPQILKPDDSKKVYEEGKRDNYCAVCDKTFFNVQNLKHHIEAIHEGVKHKCPHCSKEFGFKRFELSFQQKYSVPI